MLVVACKPTLPSHLESKGSPVRAWFEEHLPENQTRCPRGRHLWPKCVAHASKLAQQDPALNGSNRRYNADCCRYGSDGTRTRGLRRDRSDPEDAPDGQISLFDAE